MAIAIQAVKRKDRNTVELTPWPDATNTGYPTGLTLTRVPQDVTSGTGWAWDSRGWLTIDGNNAVFSGHRVDANVVVAANNVTVQNCWITSHGSGNNGISLTHASGTIIQDCVISGLNAAGGIDTDNLQFAIRDVYADSTNTIIRRCNMFDCANTVSMHGSVTMTDCYIHNTGYDPATDHVDSFITNGGGSNFVIQHNTIFNEYNQTAAIAMYQDDGTITDVLIDNNLLGGGGYTIYAAGGALAGSNIKITNNHFTTRFFPNSGNFGPYTQFRPGDPGNVWSGNVWDDGPNAGTAVT